ncbi:Carcinoembryonic antigen-related cell adhesion molecule 1 [Labeo rohita]|uniref:Carcinoembryonic antigen-related cell adhesion molecule 1 n=1 Tax=Labeo rohita TaxID=84645 RepID=A0ABQ8L6U9_LABRO|nr:Carcinoembryonic antigen-related cell adhesion molecule 1 [Labeo rohita]
MKKILLSFCVFVVLLEAVFGESVSGKEGESVTLVTGLTEIQTNDVLEWRFGAEKDLIARINKAAGRTDIDDEVLGGKFKDRLKLDDKTGSLTIINVRTTDSGNFEVSTTFAKFQKSFTVDVVSDSGLSPGAIAGIVVSVLVLIAAPVAERTRFCKLFGYIRNNFPSYEESRKLASNVNGTSHQFPSFHSLSFTFK